MTLLKFAKERFTLNLPAGSAPVDSNEMLRGDIHELKGLVHAILTKVSALEAQSLPATPVRAGVVQPAVSVALTTPTHDGVPIAQSLTTPAQTRAGFWQETEDPEEDGPDSRKRRKRS